MTTGRQTLTLRNATRIALLTAALLLACALPALCASQLEKAVLEEINAARTAPAAYSTHLQQHRTLFEGKRYRPSGADFLVETEEGQAAVDEAIGFLELQSPLPPLAWNHGLAEAAKDLAKAQNRSGTIGHGSAELAMKARIDRHVEWRGSIAENISYGPEEARNVVIQLIVDDSVPDRGHRHNIFSSDFSVAGVACEPHPEFRLVCVIDFAGSVDE